MGKCKDCKNNWMKRKTIDVEDIVKCTEDCRSCLRHNFALYEQEKETEQEQEK